MTDATIPLDSEGVYKVRIRQILDELVLRNPTEAIFRKWKTLCDELGLTPAAQLELQRVLEQTDYQNLFQNILTRWIEKSGNAATLQNLIEKLRTQDSFTSDADRLSCLSESISSSEDVGPDSERNHFIPIAPASDASLLGLNYLQIAFIVFLIICSFSGVVGVLMYQSNQIASNHIHVYEGFQIEQKNGSTFLNTTTKTQIFSDPDNLTPASPMPSYTNGPVTEILPVAKNRKQVDRPDKGLVIELVDAKKYLLPVNTNCKNKRVTLIVKITDPLASIEQFIPDFCLENVIGLELAGFVTEHHFELLMRKFPNIEFLIITGYIICHEIETYDFSLISVHNRLLLKNLIFLEISNIPECVQLFHLIFQSLSTPYLVRLDLIDVVVTITNQHVIESIGYKNPQLLYVWFKGIMCDNCESFTNNAAFKRALVTEIN